MAVTDAVTARGMSQRVKRALPTVQQNFFNQNALLKIIQQRGQIKWGGYHTKFDWFIRKTPSGSDPTWGGGELGIRTFEEVDPVNQVELNYRWLEKTYGVSDRTIETNRNASGSQKVYDSLKENMNIAQIGLYNTFGPAIYTGSGVGENPDGLLLPLGSAYESSSTVAIAAGSAYAGQTLNTSAISAYAKKKASFDDAQWAPECLSIHEVPGVSSAKWTTHSVTALSYMADEMAVTADLSGTGQMQKPDMAIMPGDPYNALKTYLAGTSTQLSNIPVGNEALLLAGWSNIQVDTLTCVKDNNVPDDSNDYERVIVLDSSQLYIETTHKKSEGLIKNDFDPNIAIINGAVGTLKANYMFRWNSPTAATCIVGCND